MEFIQQHNIVSGYPKMNKSTAEILCNNLTSSETLRSSFIDGQDMTRHDMTRHDKTWQNMATWKNRVSSF
jgi:hypothetical protein